MVLLSALVGCCNARARVALRTKAFVPLRLPVLSLILTVPPFFVTIFDKNILRHRTRRSKAAVWEVPSGNNYDYAGKSVL